MGELPQITNTTSDNREKHITAHFILPWSHSWWVFSNVWQADHFILRDLQFILCLQIYIWGYTCSLWHTSNSISVTWHIFVPVPIQTTVLYLHVRQTIVLKYQSIRANLFFNKSQDVMLAPNITLHLCHTYFPSRLLTFISSDNIYIIVYKGGFFTETCSTQTAHNGRHH